MWLALLLGFSCCLAQRIPLFLILNLVCPKQSHKESLSLSLCLSFSFCLPLPLSLYVILEMDHGLSHCSCYISQTSATDICQSTLTGTKYIS